MHNPVNENAISTEQIFKNYKSKISTTLGAKNYQTLIENTLKNGFEGDKFRNNIENIFKNFFVDKNLRNNSSEDFIKSFCDWSKDKIDQSLKVRRNVMFVNIFFLFGALGISFLNPWAGMAFGAVSSIGCSIAEGVAKRNIANIGHLQTHFGNKIENATNDLIKNANQIEEFKGDAKDQINQHQKPDNLKNQSAIYRGLSYFSGFTISSAYNITNRITPIAEIASPIIFGVIGSIIPLLPLLVYLLSSKSANQRCKTLSNRSNYSNQITEIIFNRNNWDINNSRDLQDSQNPQDIISKLNDLTKKFNSHISESDCEGRLVVDKKFKKNPKSDYNYNPTKMITLPQYIGAKIHRKFDENLIRSNKNCDLADFCDIIDYNPSVSADLVVAIRSDILPIEPPDTTAGNINRGDTLYPSTSITPASSINSSNSSRNINLGNHHGQNLRSLSNSGDDFTVLENCSTR